MELLHNELIMFKVAETHRYYKL